MSACPSAHLVKVLEVVDRQETDITLRTAHLRAHCTHPGLLHKQVEKSTDSLVRGIGRVLAGRDVDDVKRTDAAFWHSGTRILPKVEGKVPGAGRDRVRQRSGP